MEEDDLLWVLGAFPQPVFLTDGETVQWRNAAASAVLDPGASLQPMLQGTAFGLWSRRGTLRLSLPFGGALCDFSVRAMQRGLLFLADAPHEPSAAAGAALKASAILRRPLQNVMTAARELFDRVEDLEEPAATAVSSELNRGLYQLLRLCGQLTTGGELLAGAAVQVAFNFGNAVGSMVGGGMLNLSGMNYHFTALGGVPLAVIAVALLTIYSMRHETHTDALERMREITV